MNKLLALIGVLLLSSGLWFAVPSPIDFVELLIKPNQDRPSSEYSSIILLFRLIGIINIGTSLVLIVLGLRSSEN